MHARTADVERIPDELRPLFWDCDFERLQWPADRDFITARVLASGEWDAVQWLRRTAGDDAIEEWLKRRKGGGLSPEQLRFWKLILHIPHRTANAWIVESNRSPWTGRMAK
jgi:hypothetical protein